MSPPIRALLPVLDEADEAPPRRVAGAVERAVEAEAAARDRRAHRRLRDEDLQWIRNARLRAGHGVSIVDLSSGGALLDSPVRSVLIHC